MAIRQNIVVFDNEARPRQFTKRLVDLIKHIAKNRNFTVRKIFLPDTAAYDINNWTSKLNIRENTKSVRVRGIDFEFVEEMGEFGQYRKMYERIGGSLEYSDKEFVVATDGTDFLLGSY